MDTGCAWMALAFTVAAVWWFVYSVVQGSRRRREQDRRFERLETEVATLRHRLDRVLEGDSAPAAPPTEATPEPAERERRDAEPPPPEERATPKRKPESPWVAEGPLDEGDEAPATPPEEPPPAPPPQGPPEEVAAEPASPPAPRIDWEQWLGVRGVAVLGGIVLALAAVYFVRHSIEQGWVPPVVRVSLLMLAGVLSMVVGERLRGRDHAFPGNALQGAALVMLYAATWAARNLYELIGSGLAFALLALVTVAGGVLAVRHASLVIALLGLLGGFATPLLVSSGSDNVVGLFGYLLLLNAGVALVGRRRHWPLLGALSLAATVFYQGAWILGRMGDRVLVGLLILGVFTLFFVAVGELDRRREEEDREGPDVGLGVTLGAVFSPFVFGLYFAAQAELGESLLPLGGLLALLNASAIWIGHRRELPALPLGAVGATLGVLVVWPFPRDLDRPILLQCLAGFAALAFLHQVAGEWLHRHSKPRLLHQAPALIAAAAGLFLSDLFHAAAWLEESASGWFLLGVLFLAALLLRESERLERRQPATGADEPRSDRSPSWLPALAAAVGLGLFFLLSFVLRAVEADHAGPYGAPRLLLVAVLLGLALQGVALRRATTRVANRTPLSRALEWSLAAFPVLAMLALLGNDEGTTANAPTALAAGGAAILTLLVLLGATRIGDGLLLAVGTAAAFVSLSSLAEQGPGSWPLLVVLFVTACLLALWPTLVRPGGSASADGTWDLPAWRSAALAPILLALAILHVFDELVGDDALAIPALVLAGLEIVALRRALPRCGEHGDSVRAWFGGAALALVAFAVPLQLEREWLTVGWALLAAGVVLLWRRVDHAGLKLFAVGLGVAVATRLLLNPEVFTYHEPRAPFGLPVLGWLLYTYLLPAVLLLFAARLVEPLEIRRLRSWEPASPAGLGGAWAAGTLGLLGIVLTFAWINLTIFDAFATGQRLEIAFDRRPARDLTLSVAWALFALVLLGAGVLRRSRSLRWVSLVVLFATIAKVFLYDLGELEDLWRVGSLVGLALSLLAVSVLYQRFVFGDSGDDGAEVSGREEMTTGGEQ